MTIVERRHHSKRMEHRISPPVLREGQRGVGNIDVGPIRKIVEETVASGRRTFFQIADECGFIEERRGEARVSTVWLQRRLGMATYTKQGKTYVKCRIQYDVAVRIVEACGLLPVEVGL